MRLRTLLLNVAGAASVAVFGIAMPVAAAGNTVVVPTTSSQGWSTADTRPGGTASITSAYGAPAGLGSDSLNLTTDATTAAKAQLLHATNTQLSQVTNLSYWTYQQPQTGESPTADASYQLLVYLDGTSGTFTTFVYEPYWNGTVVPNTWQNWDVAAGQFWSSRSVTVGTNSVVAGAGGPPLYSLATLQAEFPNAVVVGFGANVGSFNPNYTVGVDGIVFNDTTYNFETRPTSKDDCKNGQWQNFSSPSYKNQGDCVSNIATNGKNQANGPVVITSTF
jgi:hypothetical protein